MPARATSIILVTATTFAAGGAAWLALTIRPAATEAKPLTLIPMMSMQATVPSHELRLALHRIGADAPALAAVGVTNSETITTLVNTVETQLQPNPTGVPMADHTAGSAAQVVADLEHLVQSGTGTQEDVSTLADARDDLAAATAARDGLLNDLFSAAVFALPDQQELHLAMIRANRANWTMPIEFLVVEHTEVYWVQLRNALAHERIALSRGEPVLPEVQVFLAEARAVPAVAAAISNLATHGAAVQTAWDLATAD